MDSSSIFKEEFIANCCYRLDENIRMVNIALDKITEEQVWQRPNASLNSIGNLILHLCGNMTQYGISSLKETKDTRDRDTEFSAEGGLTKAELINRLKDNVIKVKAVFNEIAIDRFLAKKQVQGFTFSGIGNCIHVVEHFSYHTGQIAFWVKLLNNKPLGFYDGQNLNAKNKNSC
jgi:uncharacterized damage-inducible protein DinB